jgi:UDP-2,4-diacetamido-2,4,6-trideoxy-beta-L-altropyranose hydrolase
MKVAFRTDASHHIGAGHVTRCLSLAEGLKTLGIEIIFICRSLSGNLISYIEERKFNVLKLPKPHSPDEHGLDSFEMQLAVNWIQDAEQTCELIKEKSIDWLVVDHYEIDADWENTLRPYVKKIMVIDDLANRTHTCDLLLDQNLNRLSAHYNSLVEPSTKKLMGSEFALLRSEFAELRPSALIKRKETKIKRILVTMGGMDRNNFTEDVLTTLNKCAIPEELQVTVVLGVNSPWITRLMEIAKGMNATTNILVDVKDMARLMLESDLAIGGAGSTSWERCCLGLPSLVMIMAENQRHGAEALKAAGAAIVIKELSELERFFNFSLRTNDSLNKFQIMSKRAFEVSDGLGVMRVANAMVYEQY